MDCNLGFNLVGRHLQESLGCKLYGLVMALGETF